MNIKEQCHLLYDNKVVLNVHCGHCRIVSLSGWVSTKILPCGFTVPLRGHLSRHQCEGTNIDGIVS